MSKSGIVYKLCCVDTDITEEYVGSTKNFNRRRTLHKTVCNNKNANNYNLYVYQFIRDNGGWNNWRMIQLEVVNYDTRRDLEAQERRWIEQIKPKLNKNIPTRNVKEYREANKDKVKEYNKDYYEIYKAQLKKRQKEYYSDNKDKVKQYRLDNKEKIKEQQKQYRLVNRDKLIEYDKHYKEINKDKIKEQKKQNREVNKEKLRQKFNCDCEGKYTYENKEKHFKTQKHKNYLSTL